MISIVGVGPVLLEIEVDDLDVQGVEVAEEMHSRYFHTNGKRKLWGILRTMKIVTELVPKSERAVVGRIGNDDFGAIFSAEIKFSILRDLFSDRLCRAFESCDHSCRDKEIFFSFFCILFSF